ncbi:alpha/beta fold hydrolase [Kitasatospora sp. NPDC048540]|uniref:alpha/beta hydrolase family protein n=1 Tax=unclassified Kitasatospora TaxID=2633591 RepID=UPI00068F9B7E|nr:alpha/beta fold hydrolase [Kitasatospora sp. MBT63]
MPQTRAELPRHLEVEAPDGAAFPLHGLAQDDPGAPVVLVSPAMGTPVGFYRRFAEHLHAAGATALVLDHRGSGARGQVPRTTGYRQLTDDLGAAVAVIRTRLPQAALTVCGHSLGGQLALVQAAEAAERGTPAPDAVALVAAGSVYHRAYGRRAPGLFVASRLMALTAAALGHWPGHRLGFGGRQPAGVIIDWAHQARTGRYRLAGADMEDTLRGLRVPVLAVDVEGDRLAPPGAVDHLCGKVPNAPVDRRGYTARDAAGGPLDHFRWARHAAPLARDLVAWTRGAHPDTAGGPR